MRGQQAGGGGGKQGAEWRPNNIGGGRREMEDEEWRPKRRGDEANGRGEREAPSVFSTRLND